MTYTYLGESGQIHQGQTQHFGRVVLERDGLGTDALVLAGHAVRLALDLASNIVLVSVDLVLGVQELGPTGPIEGAILGATMHPILNG